jgi:hypothetical protein
MPVVQQTGIASDEGEFGVEIRGWKPRPISPKAFSRSITLALPSQAHPARPPVDKKL